MKIDQQTSSERPGVDCDSSSVDFGQSRKIVVFDIALERTKNLQKSVLGTPRGPPRDIEARVPRPRAPQAGDIIKEIPVLKNDEAGDLTRRWAGGPANLEVNRRPFGSACWTPCRGRFTALGVCKGPQGGCSPPPTPRPEVPPACK